jgi:hypothetical protein
MIIGVSGKMQSGKNLTANIIQYLVDKKKMNYTTEDTKEDLESYLKNKHNLKCEWQQKAFADKLKDIVCILLNCTREQLEDREFKEKELGEEWANYRYRLHYSSPAHPQLTPDGEYIYKNLFPSTFKGMSEEDRKFHNAELIKLTPRLLLQLLGTESGRNIIHPNIWVNSLMSEYKVGKITDKPTYHQINKDRWVGYPNWIITDLRFPNELQAIKDRGGITIRVNRKPFKWIDIESWETETGKKVERVEEHPSETALDNEEFDYVIVNNGTIEQLIEKVKVVLKHSKII